MSMRALLLAYEFPPSPSPQSLRWAYLGRELLRQGIDLRVVAPQPADAPGAEWGPDAPVTRTWPGPFAGTLLALGRKPVPQRVDGAGPTAATLNWKGRLVEAVQAGAEAVLFPDIRREWNPWARRALRRMLDIARPDVLVTSHEPASVLLLGAIAREHGIPWVADLGDPVLAPYTPPAWRDRALALERKVCAEAAMVTVTSAATRDLLLQRHGIPAARVRVVTQGFEPEPEGAAPSAPGADEGILDLLYTGSFYAFRRPDALLEALARTPGVRLTIHSRQVPGSVVEAARRHPDRIVVAGPCPHPDVLRRQRRADVLVDLGNAGGSCQVPGKVYEYLGAGRPVLHVGEPGSETAALIASLRRGWSCHADPAPLAAMLARLARDKREGRLPAGLDLGAAAVARYSWPHLGADMAAILRAAADA